MTTAPFLDHPRRLVARKVMPFVRTEREHEACLAAKTGADASPLGVDVAEVTARGQGRLVQPALVGTGAAAVYIVGEDGSLAWQVVRVAAVVLLTWAGHRCLAHGTRARRAGVAFAAGCVSVAVGLGIGLPHLTKAGLHPMTLAGLLSMAAGLVLLVTGGTSLSGSHAPGAACWPCRRSWR